MPLQLSGDGEENNKGLESDAYVLRSKPKEEGMTKAGKENEGETRNSDIILN